MPDRSEHQVASAVNRQVDAWFDRNSDRLLTSFRTRMDEAQARMIEGMATAIKKGPLGRIERLESSISANQAALNEVCNQSQRTRKRLERAVGDVNGLLR